MDKICSKCLIAKSTINFSKREISKDGFNIYCKSCCKLSKNPIQDNQYAKVYREKNPNALIEWKIENPKYYKKYGREYQKNRRDSDPIFRFSGNIRSLIYKSIRKVGNGAFVKSRKTEDILGCTLKTFINYIEIQFSEGMTWNNQGLGDGYWVIDHKIPIASATTEDEIYILNYHTNLQPMWWYDNLIKGAKIL